MLFVANLIVWNVAAAAGMAVTFAVVSRIGLVQRRPGVRQFLWLIVLLKLITPPLVPLPILPGAASPIPNTSDIEFKAVEDRRREAVGDSAETARLAMQAEFGWYSWPAILLSISAAGTMLVLLVAARQMRRLRNLLADASHDERFDRIAMRSAIRMGLNRCLAICAVDGRVPPLLWVRYGRPVIVVPRRLAAQLSDDQLECIFCHELAHYVRRDSRTNTFAFAVVAIFWWNPVAWWARRELRAAQESCCDALVIRTPGAERRPYAEALFCTLEFLQVERPALPELNSSFCGTAAVTWRFRLIANRGLSHRLTWWGYALLLLAASALPFLPVRGVSHESSDGQSNVSMSSAKTSQRGFGRPAISLDHVQSWTGGADVNVAVGWAFTVNNDARVVALGVWDCENDGLQESHPVAVWDESGRLVVAARVPSDTQAPLAEGFRYVAVTPIELKRGERYVIGAYYAAPLADPHVSGDSGNRITADRQIRWLGQCRLIADRLTFPTKQSDPSVGPGAFGPNLLLADEPATANVVP